MISYRHCVMNFGQVYPVILMISKSYLVLEVLLPNLHLHNLHENIFFILLRELCTFCLFSSNHSIYTYKFNFTRVFQKLSYLLRFGFFDDDSDFLKIPLLQKILLEFVFSKVFCQSISLRAVLWMVGHWVYYILARLSCRRRKGPYLTIIWSGLEV